MNPTLQTALANLNGEQSLLNARKEAIESFYGIKLEFIDGQWRVVTPPKPHVSPQGGALLLWL